MSSNKTNRRSFIRAAGMIGAGLSVAPYVTAFGNNQSISSIQTPKASKKILILGGTGFIGPNMVKYAIERGHDVSIFTRGNSKSDTPGVKHFIGDRNNDLNALKSGKWDVVIDNNSRDYRWVKLSTEILKNSCQHYIFVSSISAYNIEAESYEFKDRVLREPIVGEDFERYKPTGDWKQGDEAHYGLTKTLGEDISHAAFPGRTTIVRPGLIVGPGDSTDRWTYWPVRIALGGEVLAPGNPSHANQVIDQRDLSEWIVRLAEDGSMGNYNGVGPASRMSMDQMLYSIWAGTGGDAKFTWVSEDFLQEQGVKPWSEIPSWIPGDALMYCSNQKSLAAGLTFRPLAVTAADTLEWDLARPEEERKNRKAGISREKEEELLLAWAKTQK